MKTAKHTHRLDYVRDCGCLDVEKVTSDLQLPTSGLRALVTGGAGFIGSHLVEALDRAGARVTVLDNLQAGKWENLSDCSDSVDRIEGDIRDSECVEAVLCAGNPSYVFHLAANASVPGSVDDPSYDFESNAIGTFVVLNQVRRVCPLARVVVASSGAVYGEPTEFPLTESSPLAPISPYGASKLSAEVEARMFHAVYGVRAVIARIFNSYGPRMPRFVVLDFLKKLQADPTRLEILGSGNQVRDLNYVSDTVQGLQQLAARGLPGQAYNVASGSSHTVSEIADMLLEILGLKDTRLHYTGQSWAGDAQHWEVGIDKLGQLGYEPAVPLGEGLRRVQKWFARFSEQP